MNKQLRELRKDLRYFQTQVRIDINSLKLSTAKVKYIAQFMRAVQKEIHAKKSASSTHKRPQ